jgi:hypothetical protein
MAFRYQDLVMDVLPAGQDKPGECKHSCPEHTNVCVPSGKSPGCDDECGHSCEHSCHGHTGDCCPSGKGGSRDHEEDHKPNRYAADLAALRQQLRECLAGAP